MIGTHRRHHRLLGLGLLAAIAGCSAQAAERPPETDEPGELRVRIDKDAVLALQATTRQVHVSGLARISLAPDVADLSIGVTSAGSTAIEAVAANNQAMTRLVDAIKKRGVAAREIQTSYVSITPRYSRPAESGPDVPAEATVAKVVGYDVNNTLSVTTRDLAGIGGLLDAALGAGSNQLNGINFRIADREAAIAQLRTKAFDDARSKAEAYAQRAGMTLGPVVRIAEGGEGSWAPEPAPMARLMAAPMAAAPMMPVSPGEQDVNLSVSVSFELRPAK